MGKWAKTVLYILGSALLTHWIPFSSFFRNVDTMIHEFSHALVAMLLSGKVMAIELYRDHSGVTQAIPTSYWSTIPIAMAGYMFASLFAWALFALYAANRQRAGLNVITAVAALSLVFFVRNPFGVTWLCGFIILNVLMYLLPSDRVRNFYFLLIAFLSLEESVFGPLWLLYLAATSPGQAGDAALLASHSPLPAVFWAALFSLFALWCAKQAIVAFSGRKSRERRTTGAYRAS
ncbi:M50 family metallopeptidase [Paenibacillus cymbidii]|uniref:M50 family metallopeptidase n=1 Tax=Paenibacillus cymbidii TaxID=1639034 RepID=UPI0010810ED6|nr:M50 family metallopeptidase [Paenibacillus cymbidii]